MTAAKPHPIRVRLAPSPTGFLHVGTARAAIFNWLFTKSQGGSFILRIEDTDTERSKPEFDEDIIQSLRWLGVDWDEGPDPASPKDYIGAYGPYRQSERTKIYEKYLRKLLDEKAAYYCFCSKERLEEERQAQLTQGMAPKYGGACRGLAPAEAARRVSAGENAIIRFKTPETKISFHDVVRGEIVFDMNLVGDFSIAKSVAEPLYNFSVVIDDEEMNISHVLRGEDHINNTPKQIIIQRALGFREVAFGHFPLILNTDRSKMSKRYSTTGVKEYREQGYLPEALLNFLALLGWHASDDNEEIMSVEELIKKFDLSRIQRGGAIFNIEKLDWMNSQYIKRMGSLELLKKIKALGIPEDDFSEKELIKMIDLIKERLKKLTDFTTLAGFFWKLPNYPPELLIWKTTPREHILENLNAALELIKGIKTSEFSRAAAESVLQELANQKGRGEVLWPLRAALSGSEFSPGPYEIIDVLGRDRSIERLKLAVKKLESAV